MEEDFTFALGGCSDDALGFCRIPAQQFRENPQRKPRQPSTTTNAVSFLARRNRDNNNLGTPNADGNQVKPSVPAFRRAR
jgi:hypothetical protein